MSTLGPEYVGPTSGFFSPDAPKPVLFSCLGCQTVRSARVCRCGVTGCWLCHLRECGVAAAVERETFAAWRHGTEALPEVRSTRLQAGDDQPLSVRRVGLRRA